MINWTLKKDRIILSSKTMSEAARALKVDASTVRKRKKYLSSIGGSKTCKQCLKPFWVIDESPRQHCEDCMPPGKMGQLMKKRMAAARNDALAKGHYAAAYEKRSREMAGKPHGRGGKIAKTHRSKKSEHPSARHHRLESPEGIVYEFDNAEFFVRTHADIFGDADRLERMKPNGKRFTRAGNGLQAVSNGNKRQWKGWHPARK